MPLTLLGFSLSKGSFPLEALPGSSPGDTLSTFLLQFLPPASRCFSLKAAPSGLHATCRPVPTVRSIASVRKADPFLSFQPPPWRSRLPGWNYSRSHLR